jgi:hypothetical protein
MSAFRAKEKATRGYLRFGRDDNSLEALGGERKWFALDKASDSEYETIPAPSRIREQPKVYVPVFPHQSGLTPLPPAPRSSGPVDLDELYNDVTSCRRGPSSALSRRSLK